MDIKLDYYYNNEADGYSFFRIPKLLFTHERYKGLSLEAKLLYGMMLDRMGLSLKNKWFDKEGKVYIYYTLEEAMEHLGYGHTKVIRIMNELDEAKGVGLIVRKKQGQGKPTIIYVKKFTPCEIQTYSIEQSENPKAHTLVTVSMDSTSQFNNASTTQTSVDYSSENKTSFFENSRISENSSLHCSDCYSNNTNNNNTEFSDTQSLNPSISPYAQKAKNNENDGVRDRKSYEDLRDYVLDAMWEEGTLPYAYVNDQARMECAIKILADYDRYEQNSKNCLDGDDFRFSAINLFTEALTEMLTTKEPMNLKGSYVTYSKVYDRVVKYINFEQAEPFFIDFPETVMSDFENACKEREIKNHLAYMKSCIWNVLLVGDMGIQAKIKKDFG